MKRFVVFLLFLILSLLLVFVSRFSYAATPQYHYQYFLNTHGISFPANESLEIRLNINTNGEAVKQGRVALNYDPQKLQFQEAVAWDIFKNLETDSSQPGKIIITSSTNLIYSGEAPFAILRFKTLSEIEDLSKVLVVNQNLLPTILPSLTPAITHNQLTTTPNPSITNSPTNNPLTATPLPTPEASPTQGLIDSGIPHCPNLEGSGSFVMLIIPDSFNNLNDFLVYAYEAVRTMKNSNLGQQNLQKFTWRIHDDISRNYRIELDDINADLDVVLALQTRQTCNADAFLIISKKYATIDDSYRTGGFSDLGGGMSVVFHHSMLAVPHELSHALTSLYEEYNMGVPATALGFSTSQSPFINCSGSSKNHCNEWQQNYPNDTKIGCFPVCGATDWFRPTQCSVMNNQLDCMDYFNAPSLEAWTNFLNQY